MDISSENKKQTIFRELSTLIVEACTWLMTVTFGTTLLDTLYARVLSQTDAAVDLAGVFHEVSDLFLLWFGVGTLLAAVAAVVASWISPAARYFYVASLLVSMCGLLIPPAIVIFLPNSALATQPGAGWWLRLIVTGIPSLLAFLGLRAFHRHS